MYKFQKKMQELGLKESDLSVRMKKKIAETLAGLEGAQAALKKAKSDKEKKEISDDIEDEDNEMVTAVEQFEKMKGVYAANSARLQKGRDAKKAGAGVPVGNTPPKDTAPPEGQPPVSAEAGVVIPEGGNPTPTPEGEGDEKKKGSFGKVFGILALVALSVIGINIAKNRI